MDPAAARQAWRKLEPVHGLVYFAPGAEAIYASLGAPHRGMGYFASRAAPLGPVGPEIVVAAFYNFAPATVRRAIPAAWEVASPDEWTAARFRVVETGLESALPESLRSGAELEEALGLASRAAEAAAAHPEGRVLFAAYSALPWPESPLLGLWHAQTLLREFRGDGHVAALVTEGLSGLEALVTHAATGAADPSGLQRSRGWTDEEWAGACDALRGRGVLDAGPALRLTPAGLALRSRLEEATDRLAAPAYEALGDEGCARLAELGATLSTAVVEAGLLPAAMRRYVEES